MFNGHLKLNISPKLLSPPIPSICTFSWNVKPILGVQVQPPSNLQLLFFSYFLIPVQFSSVAQSCPTLCDPMNPSTPGLPVYHQLPEFTQTHVHRVGDVCRPLLLLPSIPPSIRVFSKESTLRIRWPKYWSFSFSKCPSNEHPGLISSKMDWLDLLAVQGTFKGLLQYHSSKASILQCLAFLWSNSHIRTWLLEKNHRFTLLC